MNVDLILDFGEIWCIYVGIGGSEEQAKFSFPVAIIIACRAKFKKSYLTQFWLELPRSYAQIEALDV